MHAPGVLDSGTGRGSLAQFNIQPWLKQLNTAWSFRTDKVNLHALAHDPMPYVIYGAHDSSPVKEDHGALGRWGIGVGIPLWFTPIVTPPVRWKSVAFHARDIHSPHFSSENELRLFLDGVYPDN
ncbi:uncharacterized protein EI90DRAFT_3014041 [Cantharellus anzutake]|uniref:uncharacterized protein n=1 Tax=Cantharellus anzutake TaxID=1750568 RepID=UPI0019089732|nr:uncharacterized protein EI90DRAFT_3014041 [Cantharellus anzutake]KAF8337103.1 hypothetical protein EI90DRAFT_3014041 [Cantharellus anzutake]